MTESGPCEQTQWQSNRMDVSPLNASNIEAYDGVDEESLRARDPEGDAGRKDLLNPTIFQMLGDLEDQLVLDAGCGQGYLSRLCAGKGAKITGIEPSSRLLDYAVRSEVNHPLGITYLQRDLSRLRVLDEVAFDAVVANMVLLDTADWKAAMTNCIAVLRPGGRFIFSLLHPCWPPEAGNTWGDHGRVEISEYLQPYETPMEFGVNYHRPLSEYLNFALGLGSVIVEIAEPALQRNESDAQSNDIRFHVPNFVVVCVSKGRDQPKGSPTT